MGKITINGENLSMGTRPTMDYWGYSWQTNHRKDGMRFKDI